jgi:hypothetical protein
MHILAYLQFHIVLISPAIVFLKLYIRYAKPTISMNCGLTAMKTTSGPLKMSYGYTLANSVTFTFRNSVTCNFGLVKVKFDI